MDLKTLGLSPKAVLAFLFPLISAAVGAAASWALGGFGAFDTMSIVIAATGLGASGLALLGAYIGKPGHVVTSVAAPSLYQSMALTGPSVTTHVKLDGKDIARAVARAVRSDDDGDPLHPDLDGVPVTDPATIPADKGDARSASAKSARKSKRAKVKDEPLGASASGLSAEHRAKAKSLAIAAARLGLKHAPAIHYSQGASRWDWFKRKLKAYLGQFPTNLDCSAFVTWCIWNGLEHFGVRDTVNGTNWSGGGFTGTMIEHGKTVAHEANIQWGDAAIYGASPSETEHTAICVGGGMVISHGSEAGPFLLPLHYRDDLIVVKRYI